MLWQQDAREAAEQAAGQPGQGRGRQDRHPGVQATLHQEGQQNKHDRKVKEEGRHCFVCDIKMIFLKISQKGRILTVHQWIIPGCPIYECLYQNTISAAALGLKKTEPRTPQKLGT